MLKRGARKLGFWLLSVGEAKIRVYDKDHPDGTDLKIDSHNKTYLVITPAKDPSQD